MVAGRGARDPAAPLLGAHRRKPVRDAARLERARVLEELRLEAEARARRRRRPAAACAGRGRGSSRRRARRRRARGVRRSRADPRYSRRPAECARGRSHEHTRSRSASTATSTGRGCSSYFRPLLVVPHLCWLALWAVPAAGAVVAAWAAALVTGRVPVPLHRFLASFLREAAHVSAFLHLVGRPYPGFLGAGGQLPGRSHDRATRRPAPSRCPGADRRRAPGAPPRLRVRDRHARRRDPGWFAALATGRMPEGLRDLGAAALRYEAQAAGYLLLLTARYPGASPRLETPTREDA